MACAYKHASMLVIVENYELTVIRNDVHPTVSNLRYYTLLGAVIVNVLKRLTIIYNAQICVIQTAK